MRLFARTDRLAVDALRREDLEAVFADPAASDELDDLDELEYEALASQGARDQARHDAQPRELAELSVLPGPVRDGPPPAPEPGRPGEVIELFRDRR